MMGERTESLTLKWGTLKAWKFCQPTTRELLQRYEEIGMSWGAMQQQDTPEQKQLICDLIDAGDFDTVYLDWDGEHVSKERAKEYVMNYGKKAAALPPAAPTGGET